jgi:GNAT superfamily N-acetyltransferase
MSEDSIPYLELTISAEQFRQMPRHPAYHYEHLGGVARLMPRPRFYHALLTLPADLPAPALCRGVSMRPLCQTDWPALEEPFAAAFEGLQPFGSLEGEHRLAAVRRALEHTRTGNDGPLIADASFVACTGERVLGANLITLIPSGDPASWDSYTWDNPPPADCLERRLGRPHLTWIFVVPQRAGRGVGTALLAESVRVLLCLGYNELASTFLQGNDSSMLWHWRCGFRLLSYAGSRRRLSYLEEWA